MIPEPTLDAVTRGPRGISANDHGTIMADGADAVNLFRLVTIRSGLGLEIRTGMRMSRGVSMLKAANAALGTTYRSKQKAYDHLDAILSSLQEGE